ncbi:uncharacterized protein JCM6883_004880 [Sporobolomyces salmoneus]|uniref:uncharacterized protein n=1 Tax=Sporobolomyces salmoneus TaxID=183962 RepID=UPI0031739355
MGCSSSKAHSDDLPPPKTLSAQPQAQADRTRQMSNSFVERKGSQLLLDGKPFRFASLNAPELLDGDCNQQYEVTNTMETFGAPGGFGGVPVTRTYTLRIKSKNIGRGHINGWNREWNDWEWDSGRLQEMDYVLAEAAKHGVKLIIPILNQDTGEDSNWVGSTADLIKFRYGFGSTQEARQKVDWWTDHTMIESYKLIIDFLLNRKNSINSRRYGDDPTILAWETGNEMNHQGMRPAPAEWTLTIARHLKSRAPNMLVMDGSFARNDDPDRCYPKEVLESPDVDIISYHYYGSGDIRRVKKDCEVAKKHQKVFIAGEYGFFDSEKDYASFLSQIDAAGGAGSLVWSFRPRSSRGGHKTHGEGDGIWSYHVPGWKNSAHGEFDPREASIVPSIRAASFKINSLKAPSHPSPTRPSKPWQCSPTQVCFAGSAWADKYEVIVRGQGGGEERQQVWDCTKEDHFAVDLSREFGRVGGQGAKVSVRAVGVDGHASEEGEALVM